MHKEENEEKENKRPLQVQLNKEILKTGRYLFLCFYCHSHFSFITLSQLGITSLSFVLIYTGGIGFRKI